jgi:predicted nucleotidyltransferase
MTDNQIVLKDLKDILNNNFPDLIESVILFGSQINNTYSEFSDFDILVILKENYDWKLQNKIIDLCYEIDLKYNIVTDIKVISKAELNEPRGRQSYITQALSTGLRA